MLENKSKAVEQQYSWITTVKLENSGKAVDQR
jgi:hypothetical protein